MTALCKRILVVSCLAKFGERGVVNLAPLVPNVVGGAFGGERPEARCAATYDGQAAYQSLSANPLPRPRIVAALGGVYGP